MRALLAERWLLGGKMFLPNSPEAFRKKFAKYSNIGRIYLSFRNDKIQRFCCCDQNNSRVFLKIFEFCPKKAY
jgi:hypothetical protein